MRARGIAVTSREPAVFVQIKSLRKELTEKLDRLRDELAPLGHEPKRLAAHKRRTLFDCGLSLRLLDDLEAQIFAGGSEDVAATISQLIAMLKQLQTASLPGNATPVHGSPLSGPSTPAPRVVPKHHR
jgi:hypothetical protein